MAGLAFISQSGRNFMLQAPRIVITRPQEQSAVLAKELQDRGMTPVFYPGLAFATCPDVMMLDAALAKIAAGDYDMMILTSRQAARIVSERLTSLEIVRIEQPVWTVGAQTAAACTFETDLHTPEHAHDALTLLDALPNVRGKRILLPQSPLAAPTLCDALVARGAQVAVIHPYEVIAGEGGDDVPGMLREQAIRAFTFFSGSAVEGAMARLEAADIKANDLKSVPAVCFGRQTAASARDMNLTVLEGNATYDMFYTLLEQACKDKRAS
jgi:uroporphyrinogen-III synthase